MTRDIEELRGMVPPADGEPPRPDWSELSSRLGTDLPPDYRELIETYGGGRFDGYLWLLEPFSANESYDLVPATEERAEAMEMLWDGGEEKPSFLAEPDRRLIPWASTDNGEFLYWLVLPGAEPSAWPVVVNEARGEDWERYDMGCAAFLVATMSGTLVSDILSSGYPSDPHRFEPMASFG